jgi:oligosaccharide repeat unit polymerase
MEAAFFLLFILALLMRQMSPLRLLSPSFILALSWSIVFGLQSLFAPDMISSYISTVVILIVTISFAVGEILACGGLSFKKRMHNVIDEEKNYIKKHLIRQDKLNKICLIFGIFSIVGSIQYANTLGLLAANSLEELVSLPGLARVAIYSGEIDVPFTSRIGFLLAFSGVVLSLSYYYLYNWRWYLCLPMVSVLIMGLSQSGRAGTVIVILQILVAIYFKNINNKLTFSIIFKGLSILILAFSFVFIGGQFQREGFTSVEFTDMLRVIESLRGYLFGGVSAFSTWINNSDQFSLPTFGRYSFSSLFNFLGLYEQEAGIYDEYLAISKLGETSNIYTAYRSFIEDFTLFGACIFYLLCGFLVSKMLISFSSGNKLRVLILIPVYSWLAWSPMVSLTYFNSFLLSCFLPYVLTKFFALRINRQIQV